MVIWSEDDCTRNTDGHEGLEQAWLRLFGTPLDMKLQTQTIDHGDCIEHRMPDGISIWNIHGAYYEIATTEVL